MLLVQDVGQNYILNLEINMAKLKNNFYIGKGKDDNHAWLFYGIHKPTIENDLVSWDSRFTKLIGQFNDNPIGDSLEDNTVIKIIIRKETIKNKKNE